MSGLTLIRHPQPLGSQGVCYGRTDLSVAPDVMGQALATWRARFVGNAPLPIWTSPLRRCVELAEALAQALAWPAPRVDERLQELNFGAWEGMPWADIPRDDLDAWAAAPLDFVMPGGESVRALQARVWAWYAAACAEGLPALVITHAGVVRALLGAVGNLPLQTWLTYPLGFAEGVTLDADGVPVRSIDG